MAFSGKATYTAGTTLPANTAHPSPSPIKPRKDTRADASRPPMIASTPIPTAAPTPKMADSIPTSWVPKAALPSHVEAEIRVLTRGYRILMQA